jgi:hypothetical protein
MSDALINAVLRYTEAQAGDGPFATAITGLTIMRTAHEQRPNCLLHKPALCVVVQGVKWAQFGDTRLAYQAGQALLVRVEMPLLSQVVAASPSEPYLAVIIEFDLAALREVLEQLKAPPAARNAAGGGVLVVAVDGAMGDCVVRLVRLLSTPQAIPIVAPMIMRELCY